MKRLRVITIVIITAIFMFSGCLKYKNILDIKQTKKLEKSLDIITSIALVRSSSDEGWKEFEMKATSFPIGDGYQLALTHATFISEEYIVNSQFGRYPRSREVKNQKYFIEGKEIIFVGKVGDISLFKKSWVSEYPYKLGKDPVIGTQLIVIGNSILNGNNTKVGIVSMLNLGRYEKEDTDFKYCFIHTVPINEGDSGSPVLAINAKGEYEVVGIVNASVKKLQGYNIAFRISHIKKVIKELKKK